MVRPATQSNRERAIIFFGERPYDESTNGHTFFSERSFYKPANGHYSSPRRLIVHDSCCADINTINYIRVAVRHQKSWPVASEVRGRSPQHFIWPFIQNAGLKQGGRLFGPVSLYQEGLPC